jgi:hypothetical protein
VAQARYALVDKLSEQGLAALERLPAEDPPVESQQVAGAQRHLAIMPAAAQQFERSEPVGLEPLRRQALG